MGLYGRYQDPAWKESPFAINERVVRYGGVFELGYSLQVTSQFGFELYGGLGSIRHMFDYDDLKPAAMNIYYPSWIQVDYENIPFPTGSHIPIDSELDLAVTFGLITFIRF